MSNSERQTFQEWLGEKYNFFGVFNVRRWIVYGLALLLSYTIVGVLGPVGVVVVALIEKSHDNLGSSAKSGDSRSLLKFVIIALACSKILSR